jgi:hypothetical protein
VLRAILEQCCAFSSEYVEEQGGLYEVLTSEQMLVGAAAAAREDRRAAQGFVAPADARAFLELARRGGGLEARDPVTRAYFRGLAREAPARPAESAVRARAAERVGPSADPEELVQMLQDAAVIEPTPPQPVAALAAGFSAETERAGRSSLAPAERPLLLLQAALAELRSQRPDLFSRRVEELHYLANVLIAGSRDRRPRPLEALERAIAVCNTGLERALVAERALARAAGVLAEIPADQLFRRGYRR